ncbi:MAG: hypothetical protein HZB23_11635 [Deltaproteobacteria bacterium]|nr:hypothetical protein [Deltaproteobacteria bacterium]
MVAGHRGDNSRFPENTLAAFRGAVDAGASMMELDVTLSADGQPVVIHDSTLDRTTNGNGPVSALTFAELSALDAGSWFSPQFSGERIPSLDRVFAEFGGKIVINVEIKSEAAQIIGDFPPIHVQVADLVRSHGLCGMVLVSCFDDPVLADLAAFAPEIALGVLSDRPEEPEDALFRVKRVNAASYHQNALLVSRQLVEAMHENGVIVLAWTRRQDNTPETLKKMIGLGLDGFFADDPIAAIAGAARWKEEK